MSERKKQIINLIIKLIILIFIHFACSLALACWGVYDECNTKIHFSSMGYLCLEILLIAAFQIFIYINYRVKRLTATKYKVIYIVTDLIFLLMSLWFWCEPKLIELGVLELN